MKLFFKYFIVAFLVFVILCTPARALIGTVGEIEIMGSSETEVNLLEQMEPLVDENSPFFEAFQDKHRINVLLIGVNTGLTDTIMVVSFDTDAKHVDLISLPRDTYYPRQGYNTEAERKLNAAYLGSPLNTAMAVSDILMGMPIHSYALVDYKGIETIVDTMGGVPMTIEFDMKYSDPYDTPPLYINIPKGEQVLYGEDAVKFLRYRKGYKDGDIGRVKAQQEFMKSAFKQMLGFDMLKIAKTIRENVDSDMKMNMALEIAKSAVGISAEDLTTYTMPHKVQGEAPWYVYPDTEGIMEMLTEIYSIEPETTDGDDDAAGAEQGSASDQIEA